MRFGVVVFPGTSGEADCYHVLKEVMGSEVDYIWHQSIKFEKEYDCIILPGGFSHGDYLRAGSIAHFAPIMEQVKKFAQNGGLVLGIGNGFQILTEAGLLPGAFLRNKDLKFICKEVYVRVENNETPFTNNYEQGQVINIPIAHGEGSYFCDEETLEELRANNQIVLRYSSSTGEIKENYNPNGSIDNIASIINKEGNVLGMMPHPERCAEKILGNDLGKYFFTSIVKWLDGGANHGE
jgi:phosphoribosylformylglycinamidine synthase